MGRIVLLAIAAVVLIAATLLSPRFGPCRRQAASTPPRAAGVVARAQASNAGVREATTQARAEEGSESAVTAASVRCRASGTIVDSDGHPCAANLIARGFDDPYHHVLTTASGADGEFIFELGMGRWSLQAEREAAATRPCDLQVEESKDIRLEPMRLEETGSVRGSIYDADGRPCPGTRVMALLGPAQTPFGLGWGNEENPVPSECVLSDAAGRFEIATCPGWLTLQANVVGAPPAYAGVTIESRQTIDVDLRLAKARALRGRVTDSRGQPLSDIVVKAYFGTYGVPHPFPSERTTRTGVDGSYWMAEMGTDSYGVYAEREGYLRASGWFHGDESESIDLVLVRAGVIEGHVLAGAGRALPPKTQVALRWADHERGAFGQSHRGDRVEGGVEANGAFRLEKVPPGSYYVQAQAEGTAVAESAEVEVPEGAVVQGVEVTLDAGGAFRGTVHDATTGMPISFARLDEIDEVTSGLCSQRLVTSHSDGRFEVPELTSGQHRIRVSEENHASQDVIIQVPEGGVVEQDVRLTGGAHVRGRVLLDDAPPDRPNVWAWTPDFSRSCIARLQADGLYEMTMPCDGTWWISASVYRGSELGRIVQSRRIEVARETPIDGVDLHLRTLPRIAGAVRQGGAPLVRGVIYLVGAGDRDGELYVADTTDGGNYTMSGVVGGDFFVLYRGCDASVLASSAVPSCLDTAGAPTVHVDGSHDESHLDIDFPAPAGR